MKLKALFFFLSFLIGVLLLSKSVYSANSLDIIINEIAWMGTEASYSNEWIELYNNSDSVVNLVNWSLKAIDGAPEINFSGTIPGNGFYLLERTDNNSVPSVIADQIYTGALGNEGEYLQLFDAQNNLIDEINCSQGWFSGDNSTKQTMERRNAQSDGSDLSNWQTGQNSGGTPKSQNSFSFAEVGPPQAENEGVEEKVKSTSYPAGIVFSEILPSPEGPDAENEWIEIANENNFEVDLSDWRISDTVGSTHAYTFSKNTIIKSNGFLVLRRPETKITLNNSEDGLNLIRPDAFTADAVSYQKAPLGQSYNLNDGQWLWDTILTPGNVNMVAAPKNSEDGFDPSTIIQEESQVKTAQEPEAESQEITKGLAAIKEQIPEQSLNFFTIALIALFLAMFSAIIIMFLKSKLVRIDFFEKIS